ncbi:MAG: surface-adhesin E family protein [Pseudomonadota bacterium]
MRKVILIMLLAVTSHSAMAEWIGLGSRDNYTVYADPATIQKTDNGLTMWWLIDFKTSASGDSEPHMSMKTLSEFDCKEERLRTLSSSWHSEHMAEGKVVSSNSDIDIWVSGGTSPVNKVLWEFACRKN